MIYSMLFFVSVIILMLLQASEKLAIKNNKYQVLYFGHAFVSWLCIANIFSNFFDYVEPFMSIMNRNDVNALKTIMLFVTVWYEVKVIISSLNNKNCNFGLQHLTKAIYQSGLYIFKIISTVAIFYLGRATLLLNNELSANALQSSDFSKIIYFVFVFMVAIVFLFKFMKYMASSYGTNHKEIIDDDKDIKVQVNICDLASGVEFIRCQECNKYMTKECRHCSFDAEGVCTGRADGDCRVKTKEVKTT